MQAKDYLIKSVHKGNEWTNKFGTMQAYNLILEGVGEPVLLNKKVPVTYEPKEGDTIYGTADLTTSMKGTSYWKFTAQQKPPEETSSSNASTGSTWVPRDDLAIRAQWAIGQGIQIGMTNLPIEADSVEAMAKQLFTMVERVKNTKPEPVQGHQQMQYPTDSTDEPPLTDNDLPAEFRN